MTTISPTARATWLLRLAGLLRFRLSWLFVAVTAIAVVLAIKFHRAPIRPDNLDRLQKLDEIERDVFRLVWSDDRTRVAFVGWEMPVDIRETITLWPVRTLGEKRKIIEFAFSPDNQLFAWTENGHPVEIHHEKSGSTITLNTGTDQCDLDFSPDGKLLATGGYEVGAMLWSVADGRLVQKLDTGSGQGGLTVRFSPDGKLLAVGNRNYNTRVFDVATGRLLHELPKPQSHGLEFHPSGKTLAIGYATGGLALWDVASGRLLRELDPQAEEIYSLDWSPDGGLLVTSGLKSDICLWDQNMQILRRLPAPEWVISAKFSPDGSRLITAGGSATKGQQRSVQVWGVPPSLLP
jgi:WD40 repeat protein